MKEEIDSCYDVTIIGGGPSGLFAAFYAGMREMKTKVIEAAPYLGRKLPYYREKFLFDVGGIQAITAGKLVEELEAQARTFGPTIVLSQLIEKMERLSDGTIRLTSHIGETHLTRSVVIAIGGETLVPQKLELPNTKKYEGRHLHYSVDDIEQFRNKRVLISGGGDSAVDWAIALASIASFVGIVHRRSDFRAHEGNVSKMRNSSVHVMTSSQIKEISGDEEHIELVMLEQTETGNISSLEIDEIIVCHGARPELSGIKDWGLGIEQNRITVDAWMQTSIPGVFAAGDVVDYPGKLPGLIAGGFMEGPAAINRAKAYLDPHEEVRPIWSTDNEVLMAIHSRA
ncbi:ferredoxin--NADP reductase 1 [Brevibacillus reuszeri]|uniref:Ferredoxin--NADP reductase n=1 Tax=Brevibacillus reuszeri TaxID=54915 RepID=A0A0K9YRB5_9BACL|nr:NAD(P)/FAD-dependent oxidoreductase [Brevibacillus reuszeri]KNB71216.1 hypothetical protein ADS79_20610 [Brevibacillus reuszeri]MED1857651.1 NAD(P)/FAD-dependent oxidoreductase [Brevibacillus reuszeri]GED66516.1 ferredoxin--NADP reductase 1 [Brevibacillus reuszeri]